MINRQQLLSDLQDLLKQLEADLLERSDSADVAEVGIQLRAEYDRAKQAERTAHNFEDWRADTITQTAAAWVLSCVFVRFLEDNRLIDPPRLAGTGDRLKRARDEHELYFREHPTETDREYLLDAFDALAKLPGTQDVFGEHNPLRDLPSWLSGDAAGELLGFFQKIDANSGALIHDFTDPEWDTRFLGDLYQDLSEAARKKYALLQTPDFVEEFILDRTLDPALDEFGLTPDTNPDHLFKMIDPACGSGHFLLGSFPRILRRWQKAEPGTNIRVLVQRTLDSIHGVDINPFAIAIARFRLLLAALAACGVKRLADAPAFAMNLACGDSLYHGVERQQTLGDWTDESHYFRTEDAENLRRILQEGTFHAVVANPPYITVKDRAANQAYRRLYRACRGKYSLSVPFIERIFRLAVSAPNSPCPGYTGQITSNSFMKREFGKDVIQEFLPSVDLTHVVDTSGAYIPGHGTPTVILAGRNRPPTANHIRTVMGILGEPSSPSVPSEGKVWTAILKQIDLPDSTSPYVSAHDVERGVLAIHPWSLVGGGASALKEHLDSEQPATLGEQADIGIGVVTLEDDAYEMPCASARRMAIPCNFIRQFVVGDCIRNWHIYEPNVAIFPHDKTSLEPLENARVCSILWPLKTLLANRTWFRQTQRDRGMKWFEYGHISKDKFRTPLSLTFAFVATHNHVAIDRGGSVFKNSAPMVKFDAAKSEKQLLGIAGLMNCSIAGFWFRQVAHNMGDSTDDSGARTTGDPAFNTYQFNGTQIERFPLPGAAPVRLATNINSTVEESVRAAPSNTLGRHARENNQDLASELASEHEAYESAFGKAVGLQEDLDWECYRLYGLLEDDLTYPSGESLGIQLGERAFEIVLARKMARGEVQTTWFERHGSTPITELPDHWPDDYKQLVQRRIDVIESNPQIALIEQPEYKRRWNTTPWEEQVEKALKSWLLDRLESYFDFDGRMNDEGQPTATLDIGLTSVGQLADAARKDPQFLEVGEVYRDDAAFDVQRLVEELVQAEHVPLLPILRYKPPGLRKRQEWEHTWELQRQEDVIDARTTLPKDDPEFLTEDQATDLKQREVGDIPVPPKYKSSDFISSGGARYWSLRGKLDVPKERWISFPHCEGPDGTLMIAWAGYDHLQLARAISSYYVDVQERLGGRDDPRLVPLLACLIELLPWLKQWHNEVDPEFGVPMGDYFDGFVTEEARNLGVTAAEVRAWEPPKKSTRKTARRKTSKKSNELFD
ncbi:MAG: BREX-2 system adenine-specific DNA-methyltransferase PglX [Planctomycetaceae bacterium]